MAEPQASTHSEQMRGKENAAGATQGEPRSFEQGQAGRASAAAVQDFGRLARTAAEGGRQLAETGRRAGQQVTEALRHTFDPFLAMQLDANRWFDDIWRQALGFRATPAMPMLRPFGQMGAAGLFGLPPTDLQETENAHLVSIELPGLTKDDVDIAIDGDALTVCGHKSEATEDASATWRVSERRFGRFERSFPLPPDVDRQKIQAQFRDGVLKITLPKNPQAAAARSKIQISG